MFKITMYRASDGDLVLDGTVIRLVVGITAVMDDICLGDETLRGAVFTHAPWAAGAIGDMGIGYLPKGTVVTADNFDPTIGALIIDARVIVKIAMHRFRLGDKGVLVVATSFAGEFGLAAWAAMTVHVVSGTLTERAVVTAQNRDRGEVVDVFDLAVIVLVGMVSMSKLTALNKSLAG